MTRANSRLGTRNVAVPAVLLWAIGACSGCFAAATGPENWSHVDFVERYTFSGVVEQNKDLSGIACVSPTRCLIGADEGRNVQVVELSRKDRVLKIIRTVALAKTGKEIDIEAIACEGNRYYIIGSHGLAKKTGDFQSNRYKLFRLKVDPNTGQPDSNPRSLETTSLVGILQRDPVLSAHFDKPLQQKGVNIEGLAIRNGTLYVGLRNPNIDGFAFVIEVKADELFSAAGPPKYVLRRVSLGKGLGIREIVAARSCFLILAGDAGSEPSEDYPQAEDYDGDRGFAIFAWDGQGTQARRVGPIPDAPAKAEAMTILDESADHVTVLVLFDGAANGRPAVYRIH
jgi:hypothetical protein